MRRGYARFLLFIFLPLSVHADIYTANEALARGDYDTAVQEFRTLANQGNPKAQAHLGYMYYVGEGVRQDYEEGIKWYRMAANQGDRDAQYNLAVAYAFGEGVNQDYRQAITWYRLAAQQGHLMAQYSLGISYTYGEGVEQDSTEAVKWFTRAAEQGYDRAQVQLGSKYHTGEGVPQDYEQAARWYRAAADRGNAAAQFNLGTLYRSGQGVPQDYNQARRWFRLAADQGYVAAQNELASLERVMAGSARTRSTRESSSPAVRPETIARRESTPSAAPVRANPVTETMARSDEPDLLTLKDQPAGSVPGQEEPAVTEEDQYSSETPPVANAEEYTSETPATEDVEESTEKKPGFFSRLFGRRQQRPEMDAGTEEETATTIDEDAEQIVTDEEVSEAQAATTAEADSEGKKPLFGLFGRLFKKKDQQAGDTAETAMEASDSEVAEESEVERESGWAPSESYSSRDEAGTVEESMTAMEDDEEVAVAENSEAEQESGWAPSESYSSREKAEAETDEGTGGETEKKSRFGFLGRLFGKSNKSESEDTQSVMEDEETVAMVHEPDSAGMPAEEDLAPDESGEEKRGFFGRLFGKSSKEEQESGMETGGDESTTYEPESYSDEPSGYKADPEAMQLAFASLENNNYDEAYSQFRSIALLGDPIAQYQLGTLYYQGLGTQRDYYEAARWYRRAAERGNVDAQYSLGNMYLMGEGIDQDDSLAANWYEKAAAQGHESARHNLENLERVTEAQSEEMVTYKGASEEELSESDEGTQTEKKSRFGFFKKLFKKDKETAEADVEEPVDTEEPTTEPSETVTDSEDKEEKKGFFSRLFGKGDSKEPDPEETSRPVEEAIEDSGVDFVEAEGAESQDYSADANSTTISDYETGNAYFFGDGVPKDSAEAFKWYLKSAQQGYAPAQYKVGSSYAYGDGVEKDPMEATNWYRQAAQQGYTLAQRNLGMMYSSGTGGIRQDKALALAWYSILADKGNIMDIRRRDLLESELNETERERSRQLKENLISYINTENE